MFINKLKTRFNSLFFTEWFQMQKEVITRFEEIFPQGLNKCLQKFYLLARKRDGPSVIACQIFQSVGNST